MPNRLSNEKSPYLLQHANNPVDWYPWGEEAFRKARDENRPIFLSIGYSTCHWCHVMERESFENPAIAEQMNHGFVNIKIDREERPDVDRVYMTYVQAATGSGGWPLSVWLTPDLKPFYGGTYFPPDDRYGRPGFPAVLQKITEIWTSQRDEVLRSSEQISEQLKAATSTSQRQMLDSSVFYKCFKTFQASYDAKHGGFGQAPKFPRAVTFNFMFRYFSRTGDEEAARMVLATLFGMAHGGMYDHLGGGFHRYSVDPYWHVPHFEKMLYDQAQLATSYLEAWQITHIDFFSRIARETLDYVLRDLSDPATGAFFSAEDADSAKEEGSHEKSEGAFYVWTAAEIQEVLGADAEVFSYYYGALPEGNADDPHGELTGKNVLHIVKSLEDTAKHFERDPQEITVLLAQARSKLLEARNRRPRPHRDDKVIAAWNGLMISALAKAWQALEDPRYLEAAQRAARFVASILWDEKAEILARRYRDGEVAFEGYLEDYALVVQGFLDLYEAGFELEWLARAVRLMEKMIELFWDQEGGGFFSSSGRDPSVLFRLKDDYDGAEPSGNAIAALNLLRLSEMLDRSEWRDLADRAVQAFSARLAEAPHALPQLLIAFLWLREPASQIVIAGERTDAGTCALLRVVNRTFLPQSVRLLADRELRERLAEKLPLVAAMSAAAEKDGRPAAYLCRNFVCERPVQEPAALVQLLGQPGGR